MICIVGLVFADSLCGPIRWKFLLPALVVGLLIFDLLGAYRTYRNQPFGLAISAAFEEFSSRDYSRLGEFTGMLGKEALVRQLVDGRGRYLGTDYLVRQSLYLIPSQIAPVKLETESTGEMLSRIMLGPIYKSGAGAAGTTIGDGYRMAGSAGVPLLGALLGSIIGLSERFIRGGNKSRSPNSLFRLAIFSGLCGWTYLIIRSDLGELLVILFYDVALPLLVVGVIARAIGSHRHLSPTHAVANATAPAVTTRKQ